MMVAVSGAALIQIREAPGPVPPHRAGQYPNVCVPVVLLGCLSVIQLYMKAWHLMRFGSIVSSTLEGGHPWGVLAAVFQYFIRE